MIVEIPKIEVKLLVDHLGDFPIRSHLYHAYESLKAALDLEEMNLPKVYSEAAIDYEQQMRDIKTPPEKKAITSEKPSPLAMAREFVKNKPDATSTEVNKFLLDNFVKPTTASATAYKLFRKN